MAHAPIENAAPQWGTIAAAAAEWQVSPVTIRRMIARGEIKAERFGPRLIRVDLSSLDNASHPLVHGDAT